MNHSVYLIPIKSTEGNGERSMLSKEFMSKILPNFYNVMSVKNVFHRLLVLKTANVKGIMFNI